MVVAEDFKKHTNNNCLPEISSQTGQMSADSCQVVAMENTAVLPRRKYKAMQTSCRYKWADISLFKI